MAPARARNRLPQQPSAQRRQRVPFVVQWMVAVAVAMLLGGAVRYGLAARQIADRITAESMNGYTVQARLLEDILAKEPDPARRAAAVRDQLRQMRQSYGTGSVGLFDSTGRPVFGPASDVMRASPEQLAQVVATRRAAAVSEAATAADGGRHFLHEFLLPVRAPEGLLVLEVHQREDVTAGLVSDLSKDQAIGLLVAILLAIPAPYFVGGRRLRRRQLASEQEADTDALTGLAGRRPFRPALEEALAHQVPVALALIDLDGFKQVNDRLGHSYGDRVLIAMAQSFDGLRATDSAFRLGGDEFAIVLPGADDRQASEAMDRVRKSLAVRSPDVTFSCGIASRPAGEVMPLQELWERSDAALYEAKRRGRRQSVTFETMSVRHTVSAEKLDAVTALLDDESGITAAFQPIWDLRRGVVLGHEALLRLPPGCPVDGPQEAFELAQRLGVAAALDARARRAVLDAVRDRQWQGLLFINVHPDALESLEVDALVVDLAVAGLDPTAVVLEVTEQAGLDHPAPIRVLKRAQERGFRLALDDMGHSNAGLRALTLVPFDIVKLDRQVIARLDASAASAATVAAATTFVQRSGGWVIAEGIEDTRSLAALLRGAHFGPGREPVMAGQGYLLGRPQPVPLGLDEQSPFLQSQPAVTLVD